MVGIVDLSIEIHNHLITKSDFKLETVQMRADRKCSSVNFERRFDLIFLRAENEASQT